MVYVFMCVGIHSWGSSDKRYTSLYVLLSIRGEGEANGIHLYVLVSIRGEEEANDIHLLCMVG